MTLWPYLLIIPALLLGILLGWQLQAARQGALAGSRHGPSQPLTSCSAGPNGNHPNPHEASTELEYLDRQLSTLNESITTTRLQLEELDDEHARLLVGVDEQQATIRSTRSTLHNVEQDLHDQQERLLVDLDASGEELEMLKQLNRTYASRIERLTQQAQRQDSELQTLRQAVKAKTAEIKAAHDLIEQQDAELRRLNLQRQQRDADLDRVRQQLAQRSEELRALLEHQQRSGVFSGAVCSSGPHRLRRDVTPPARSRLSAGNAPPPDGQEQPSLPGNGSKGRGPS